MTKWETQRARAGEEKEDGRRKEKSKPMDEERESGMGKKAARSTNGNLMCWECEG
jgi:hypothetical protein